MNRAEKLAVTASQLVEAKLREIRPQLVDAATRGLDDDGRNRVTAALDDWLIDGPEIVADEHHLLRLEATR